MQSYKYKDRHNLILELSCAYACVLTRANSCLHRNMCSVAYIYFCSCACEATES